MENHASSSWDVPRPALRLWLTLALGALGAWLFPWKREGFFPIASSVARSGAPLVWIAAAMLAVLLLQRVEKTATPHRTILFMGLALALSLLFPPRCGEEGRDAPARSVWVGCMGVLLLLTGALASGLSFPRGSSRRWIACLLRGPAIALAAPLLLFASHRRETEDPPSRVATISGVAFAVFPFVLGAGLMLWWPGGRGYDLARNLGVVCLSFSLWAWLGCALLFLLSSWPEHPRIPDRRGFSRERLVGYLGTAVFVTAALCALAESGYRNPWKLCVDVFQSIHLLCWPLLACAALLLLSPWPACSLAPRMGELPRTRQAGPVGTAVFLAMALVFLGSLAFGPFLYVVSGRLFVSQFDRVHVGGALDQPSLTKWFFLFAAFATVVLPYVVAARWAGDRSTRWGYWAFAAPTIALCLLLLSVLTLPAWWLLQYIHAMGFTPMRVSGLVFALCGYVSVLGFLWWVLRSPGKPLSDQGIGSDQATPDDLVETR